MTLELNRLTGQVDAMGAAILQRQDELLQKLADARSCLRENSAVTPELLEKIKRAESEDAWRRGAVPLGEELDAPTLVARDIPQAVLVATDGSQIFPDRDAAALYYVINIGSIVFRVGSNQAPSVASAPEFYYQEEHLHNADGQLRSDDEIGAERGRRELQALADLVEAERAALGGDLAVPIVALTDGPLLPWLGADKEDKKRLEAEMNFFVGQMKRLQAARAIPVGYTDRPRSAYVLRILELITTKMEAINRDTLRRGPFISLADRQLFAGLRPGERSALFATSSETNQRYKECSGGDRIAFFYANMARPGRNDEPAIARFETPEWVAKDPEKLNLAQAVVADNCAPLPYPYVLARAHELAVVTEEEKASLNDFLAQIMWRNGLVPAISAKAQMKVYSRGARR